MSDTLNLEFPPPDPSEPECDFILGQYMRAWNQVEFAVRYAIWALLRTDQQRADLFTSVFQMAALRSFMEALASHVVRDKSQQAEFAQLMEELKALSGIRNRLVHGTWMLRLTSDKTTKKITSADFVRFSPTTDAEDRRILHSRTHQKSAKLQNRHEFSPERIVEETNKLRPFCERLRGFIDQAQIAPLEPPRRAARPMPDGQT